MSAAITALSVMRSACGARHRIVTATGQHAPPARLIQASFFTVECVVNASSSMSAIAGIVVRNSKRTRNARALNNRS